VLQEFKLIRIYEMPYLTLAHRFSFFTTLGCLALLIRPLPGLMGVQDPPEFIKAGKGLLFFLPTLFDYAYHLVGYPFTTTVDAKNVGFQFVLLPSLPNPPCPPLPKGGGRIREKWMMFGKSISQEKSQIRHRLG
jgi:hypothetical protein